MNAVFPYKWKTHFKCIFHLIIRCLSGQEGVRRKWTTYLLPPNKSTADKKHKEISVEVYALQMDCEFVPTDSRLYHKYSSHFCYVLLGLLDSEKLTPRLPAECQSKLIKDWTPLLLLFYMFVSKPLCSCHISELLYVLLFFYIIYSPIIYRSKHIHSIYSNSSNICCLNTNISTAVFWDGSSDSHSDFKNRERKREAQSWTNSLIGDLAFKMSKINKKSPIV